MYVCFDICFCSIKKSNSMQCFKTVTTIFLLTVSLCAFGQKTNKRDQFQVFVSNDDRFLIDSGAYRGQTALDTLYYPDKKIKAIGNVALEKDSSKSDFKVGLWTEYFSNGQVKSKGLYQIDSYIQCCAASHCRQYLNYKLGLWEYYYETGQIKASGTYNVKTERIHTSCKGGAKVLTSHVDSSWTFWNDMGIEVKLSDELRTELENASY